MGGHAFCTPSVDRNGYLQPALYTPRLPKRIYKAMKETIVGKLNGLFRHVVVPIEHPEKKDHGDVDALVCGLKDELCSKRTIFDLRGDIARQLGADEARSWCDGNHTGFFAVPVPASIISLGTVPRPDISLPMLGSSRQYWVQVDVQIVTAPIQIQWHRFRLDHATLQPILTLGLRPAGFIFKNDGFYIRIPGPERPFGENQPKTPLIFLTSDVLRLLQFLELPSKPYNQPFESCETYWKWVTSARHFAREHLQPRLKLEMLGASNTEKSAKDKKISGYTSGSAYYFSRRDSMKMFTDEWLPAHPHIGTSKFHAEEIFQEALAFFDVRNTYQTQWRTYRNEGMEGLFWNKVIAKLSEIKYAELDSQTAPNRSSCEEGYTRNCVNLMTCELARGLKAEESENTFAAELEQKEKKKIRKIVNEAVLTLKRRTVFEARPGYGKYPTVKEEPMNDVNCPKWVSALEESGMTEDELLDWIASHAFSLLTNERDRTRPTREAKRVARKEAADRKKCSDVIEMDLIGKTSYNGNEGCRAEGTCFEA